MSNIKRFSSRKEVTEFLKEKGIDTSNWSEEKWLQLNKGQAEIHMMALAEKIYDAMNESTPEHLKSGQWHVPFIDKIVHNNFTLSNEELVKISTAMAAHTSYTIVGGEAVKSYEKWIELHDKLIAYNPPYSSPMEHCARAMNNAEYESFYKGQIGLGGESGWCNNLKGFIPYRYFIDNKIEL